MKKVKTLEDFLNEKIDPKKGFMISKEVQSSIDSLCETMLHSEAVSCDENEDPEQTYEKYIDSACNFMKEKMNERMEIWKSDGKYSNR